MRLRSIIFIAALIIPVAMISQISEEVKKINVDSLQQILPTLEGKNEIDALNKVAFSISRNHTDSSIRIADHSRILSEKLGYKKGMADAHMNLGIAYLYLDSLRYSVNHHLDALRIYESIDTCWEMGCVLKELQGINFYTGRFAESKRYGREAIKVFEHLSKHNYVVRTLVLLGLTCTEIKEYDSSEYYHNMGLSILDSYPDPFTRASIYFDQGYNTGNKDSTFIPELRDEVISWYEKALELSTSLNDTDIIVLAMYNLSYSLWVLGDPESVQKGIALTYRVKDILEKIPIRTHLLIAAYKRLAFIAYYEGDYTRALALLHTGIEAGESRMLSFDFSEYPDPTNVLLNKFYFKQVLQRSHKALADIYSEIGDFENALEHYRLERQAADELYKQDNMNLIAMLEADSKNEQIANHILMLESEKEISELQATQSRYFNIGLGGFIFVLVFVSLMLIRQNKIKNEYRNTLLEQKLLRLQMNPHFIFNALSSIHSLMNPKDVGRASIYLGNFSHLLRSTLESSRKDYILLEDEISSIRNYLELQSLRFENKFEYTIYVDPGIKLNTAIIPPMLIQPFIENAIEHGIRHKEGRGNIKVKFELEKQKIICEIEDDGVGREKAWEIKYTGRKENKSLATKIIHDRITVLNKKLRQKISLSIIDLRSENKQSLGTMVRLDLPYILD
jgi:tetratricopeptide (TPR) repeat protein